ncbi:hypothetical protein H6G33_13305 [Calothrix sp. FACHB-1219]|uniref:hypothetical protein n=1 Tax=Calothrix sp. FACHB-1219 TaxID=2692778 RepID=UPI001688ECD3|nr:hypothetical protein [Calothrix sp. FACHB-1219]MBD2218012.1 hypothetical protein [Calothrix sp. FACHB-1219]
MLVYYHFFDDERCLTIAADIIAIANKNDLCDQFHRLTAWEREMRRWGFSGRLEALNKATPKAV